MEEATIRERVSRSRSIRVFREAVLGSRLGAVGFLIVTTVILMALFAPEIALHDPNEQNIATAQLAPPSLEHPMGTDQYGRDIFSRIVYGARLSLEVSVTAVSFAVLVGVPLGLLAGYYKGYTDEVIMRGMDIIFSFPAIVLAIAIMAVLGQSLVNLIIAIGVVYTPIFARVTRSGVLSVREEEYVTAAKSIGDSNFNVILKDVLPNVLAPIIVQATVSLAFAILAESALSFLGLGTPPPTPSWGRMLSSSRNFMETAWWTVTFPGIAIMITILGFNFLGDTIRDTLDPKHDSEAGGSI